MSRRVTGTDYQPCAGGCGKLARTSSRSGLCRTCWQAKRAAPQLGIIPCEQCGEPFQQKPKAHNRPPQSYCSKSCATKARNLSGIMLSDRQPADPERTRTRKLAKSRRRRLLLGAQGWDGITDHAIFVRDNWTCAICHQPIDPRLRYPDPDSASVDHILALARGGDDTQYNKQAAHLGCNHARGDGHPGDQLTLPYGPYTRQRIRYVPCPICGLGLGVSRRTCPRHRPLRWCIDCDQVIPGGSSIALRCTACRERRAAPKPRPTMGTCAVCPRRATCGDHCWPHYKRLTQYGQVFADIPIAANHHARREVASQIQERITQRVT